MLVKDSDLNTFAVFAKLCPHVILHRLSVAFEVLEYSFIHFLFCVQERDHYLASHLLPLRQVCIHLNRALWLHASLLSK